MDKYNFGNLIPFVMLHTGASHIEFRNQRIVEAVVIAILVAALTTGAATIVLTQVLEEKIKNVTDNLATVAHSSMKQAEASTVLAIQMASVQEKQRARDKEIEHVQREIEEVKTLVKDLKRR